MDFSSWQTWALLIVGAVVVLGLIGMIGGKPKTPDSASTYGAQPAPPPAPPRAPPDEVVRAVTTAFAALTSRFDRDMYIDDMTEEQLEDEHVWRTAFIACHYVSAPLGVTESHPATQICRIITGKPFDRQLLGLTEYYLETAFDDMMAAGEDRYWDEELIALKDQWSTQKREQIILAALIPLARAHDLYVAIRREQPGPHDSGAHLIPYVDRVGDAFFGDQAPQKMADLRRQAAELADQITL